MTGILSNLLGVMLSIVVGAMSSLLATRIEHYIKKKAKQKKRKTKGKSPTTQK